MQRVREQLPSVYQSGTEGGLPWGQSQQISRHANLSIAIVSCSDADHGDRKVAADATGQLCRHMLQHDGETAGSFQNRCLGLKALLAHRVNSL